MSRSPSCTCCPVRLQGWTGWAYMPTKVGPHQKKKGYEIIDDAARIARDTTVGIVKLSNQTRI